MSSFQKSSHRAGRAVPLGFGESRSAEGCYSGRLTGRLTVLIGPCGPYNTIISRSRGSALEDAQESERRAISRERHDEGGQSLGALLVDIGRLSTAISGDRPEVKAQLDNLKSVAERTFQTVRNIAFLLRPSMLDDLGLAAALEWQGREVSRSSEIEVALESEGVPEDLPDGCKICVYRLVQEALNNAVSHSDARNAKVLVDVHRGAGHR